MANHQYYVTAGMLRRAGACCTQRWRFECVFNLKENSKKKIFLNETNLAIVRNSTLNFAWLVAAIINRSYYERGWTRWSVHNHRQLQRIMDAFWAEDYVTVIRLINRVKNRNG